MAGSLRPKIVGAGGSVAPPKVTSVGGSGTSPSGSSYVPQFPPGEGPLHTGTPPPTDIVPPVVQDPGVGVGGDAAGVGLGPTDFPQLNADALDSALKAIELEFGLTREQLMRERGALGEEYRLLSAQAERERGRALEGVEQGVQERGIVRSGIAAEAYNDTELAFADQQAGLSMGLSSGQEMIDSELSALAQQRQLAQLDAERQAESRALDLDVLRLLSEAGL